jgi:circadian clock protein KaiB
MARPKNRVSDFERASAQAADQSKYVLQLFVAGATPQSSRALTNLKEICETHLRGHYELEVVDVYQQPALAKDGHVIAVPTLLKKLPAPLRRLVGDLSDKEQVLVGLNLKPKPT